jgi:putative transposase
MMIHWPQCVSLGLARLAGRVSLRDVISNLKAQTNKLYHLGCAGVYR